MTAAHRRLVAAVLMSVGLVALVVDSATSGWTTLGAFGVGCFALAIAAELVAIRNAS